MDLRDNPGLAAYLLSRVAANAPHALSLAAQLFGVAPCEGCGFVKSHCICHEDGKGLE